MDSSLAYVYRTVEMKALMQILIMYEEIFSTVSTSLFYIVT